MLKESRNSVISEDEPGWGDRGDRDDDVGAVARTKRPSKSRLVFVDEDEDPTIEGRTFTAEMIDMYEDSIKNLEEGEIVQGRVL